MCTVNMRELFLVLYVLGLSAFSTGVEKDAKVRRRESAPIATHYLDDGINMTKQNRISIA